MIKKYKATIDWGKIKYRRYLLCLNRKEVAKNAGIHPNYLALIENGKANPTIAVMEAIAYSLAIDLIDLLDDREERVFLDK